MSVFMGEINLQFYSPGRSSLDTGIEFLFFFFGGVFGTSSSDFLFFSQCVDLFVDVSELPILWRLPGQGPPMSCFLNFFINAVVIRLLFSSLLEILFNSGIISS